MLLVTYTYLADVIAGVVKCLYSLPLVVFPRHYSISVLQMVEFPEYQNTTRYFPYLIFLRRNYIKYTVGQKSI